MVRRLSELAPSGDLVGRLGQPNSGAGLASGLVEET